jgi:hypothetical protein
MHHKHNGVEKNRAANLAYDYRKLKIRQRLNAQARWIALRVSF